MWVTFTRMVILDFDYTLSLSNNVIKLQVKLVGGCEIPWIEIKTLYGLDRRVVCLIETQGRYAI